MTTQQADLIVGAGAAHQEDGLSDRQIKADLVINTTQIAKMVNTGVCSICRGFTVCLVRITHNLFGTKGASSIKHRQLRGERDGHPSGQRRRKAKRKDVRASNSPALEDDIPAASEFLDRDPRGLG